MEIAFVLVYICLFLSSLLSYPFIKKKTGVSKPRAKLPPGSMGWPYVGETLQLYSHDPNVFFAAKQIRFIYYSYSYCYYYYYYYPFEWGLPTFIPLFSDMEKYSKHIYLGALVSC